MTQPESEVAGATAEQPGLGQEQSGLGSEQPGLGQTAEQPRVVDTAEHDPVFFGSARVPPPRTAPDQLPPIDPSELVGLYDDTRGSAVRRVSPLEDEPSLLVARYLFPTERYRGEWRRHVIHLVSPILIGVFGSVGLGLLAGFLQAASFTSGSLVVSLAVLAWLVVLGWVGWRLADWHFDRFILTNKRVMKVSGIITRKVAMMPLLRVTDMKYEQSPLGRILNYGTFVIESAGQDQALREVPHLPNPNELYLRVVEEMYEPEAVEARTSSGRDDDDDEQGDA